MSQTTQIFFDESSYVTDEMYETIAAITKPRPKISFYKRHELAIWLTIVAVGITAWTILLSNNAELLWKISTPIMEYIP